MRLGIDVSPSALSIRYVLAGKQCGIAACRRGIDAKMSFVADMRLIRKGREQRDDRPVPLCKDLRIFTPKTRVTPPKDRCQIVKVRQCLGAAFDCVATQGVDSGDLLLNGFRIGAQT